MFVHKELKKAILNWMIDNENEWQRVNACCIAFRPYIYDVYGDYLIGGEDVIKFIRQVDKLLYGK